MTTKVTYKYKDNFTLLSDLFIADILYFIYFVFPGMFVAPWAKTGNTAGGRFDISSLKINVDYFDSRDALLFHIHDFGCEARVDNTSHSRLSFREMFPSVEDADCDDTLQLRTRRGGRTSLGGEGKELPGKVFKFDDFLRMKNEERRVQAQQRRREQREERRTQKRKSESAAAAVSGHKTAVKQWKLTKGASKNISSAKV